MLAHGECALQEQVMPLQLLVCNVGIALAMQGGKALVCWMCDAFRAA